MRILSSQQDPPFLSDAEPPGHEASPNHGILVHICFDATLCWGGGIIRLREAVADVHRVHRLRLCKHRFLDDGQIELTFYSPALSGTVDP